MKAIVINGSPKGENSNTLKLTHAFLEGICCEDTEILHVSKTNVKPCLGCFSCWSKTPGKCVINDDMGEILRKLISADIIILSFPLYFSSIPGSMKNLIDRQLPLMLPQMSKEKESGSHLPRFDLSKKRHIAISTCGFWTAKGNYDAVTAMFDHYYTTGSYTKIFCGQGELFRVSELKHLTDPYLEIVKHAGEEFANDEITEETLTKLSKPLIPRDIFEKKANASW